MATRYGTLYMDDVTGQNPGALAAAKFANAKVVHSLENFAITAGDAQDSTYYVARVPRDAVPLPGNFSIVHGANMPADLDFGDSFNPDGLVDGYNGSSGAGSKDCSPAIADVGKPFWELLGYAAEKDAPVLIDLFLTRKSASTHSTTATGYVRIAYTQV